MFKHISAVVLFVQDFPKALKFYEDAIGLEVVQRETQFAAFKLEKQDFALVELSDAAEMIGVELSSFEAQTGAIDRVMLCAKVENVDIAYETLKARGVEFTKAPTDQYWGIRAAYFRDPEGNIWEIAHSIETAA